MSSIWIKGVEYDTDDIIGTCTKCGGETFNEPILINYMKLTPNQTSQVMLGVLGFDICPKCNHIDVWTRPIPPER